LTLSRLDVTLLQLRDAAADLEAVLQDVDRISLKAI
jgi:hypothetical protein